MGWIKDNLIFCLAGALVLCGVTILLLMLSKAHLKTDYVSLEGKYTTLKADFSNVSDAANVNAANVKNITDLYNKLVSTRALEKAAAEKKAAEFEEYKAATGAALDENRRLRAELARRDVEVDRWLKSALPQPLACQLWPEAKECAK